LALDAVVKTEILPHIKNVKDVMYGFVQAESATQLAAIFYVSIPGLTQAAPLFVEVGGQRFPVVIRPRAREINAHANVTFNTGQVTCAARMGNDYGVLTAAHVVGGKFRHGKFTVAQYDLIACSRANSSSDCSHRVLAVDPIMDAVLIEAEIEPADYDVVKSWSEPGFNTIIIESPLGPVPTRITQVPERGLIPTVTDPEDSPRKAAYVYCIESGTDGWSGSMVVGQMTGAPYGMFMGAYNDETSKLLGRVEMLRQIELVWGTEILKRRKE
jgi:hypothetical protein